MKKSVVVTLIAVSACGFAAGAFAQDVAHEALRWIGAAPSHLSFERYDMSLGVTAGQQPRRPERIEEDREVLNVPGHYGKLVGVTGDATASVFWYQDAEGSLRNVVVRDSPARAVKLECMPTARYEADVREQKR